MFLKASRLTRVDNNFSDDTKISVYDYELDAVGNRTVLKELAGTRVTWTYDDTYQLKSEHRGGPNVGTAGYRNTYTYDAAGNRTIKNADTVLTTSTYDVANQLSYSEAIAGRTTYTYDADGSEQVVEEPSGSKTTTTWDYENLPTLYELPDATRVTMTYNADNDRVEKETSTGTTKFVWDDANYLLETDAANVTSVVYTNESNMFGNLISQRRGATTHWCHFDALGSLREATDMNETVTDTWVYNAWGETINRTGSTLIFLTYIGELGYYYDPETGTFWVRKRPLKPAIARWTTPDPSFSDGLDWYLYVLNNAVNAIDPNGLQAVNPRKLPGMYPKLMTGCNKFQQYVLRIFVHRLLKLIDDKGGRSCFNDRKAKSRPERVCRSQLNACLATTLKNVEFECRACGDMAANARVHGFCRNAKDQARTHDCSEECIEASYPGYEPGIPYGPGNPVNIETGQMITDPTCNACSPEDLAKSRIVLCTNVIPGGFGKLNDMAGVVAWANAGNRSKRRDLYRTLTHEALHFCVGKHTRSRDIDKCGRPDAAKLALVFGQNCVGAALEKLVNDGFGTR